MRKLFLLYIFLLNGCFYSNGCLYTPQMVNCVYEAADKYPDITRYHKKNTIGNTNADTRWKDAISCGAKYTKDGWVYKTLKQLDDFDKENINGIRKFSLCMIDKGYVVINKYDCWKKNICI